MKIALFTDTYDEINGIGNTFRNLIDYCEKTNKEFHVYTKGDMDEVEERGTVKIFRYKSALPIPIYSDLEFDMKIPRIRIRRNCRKEKYDLIHLATPGSMGVNGLFNAIKDKIPCLGTYHTTIDKYTNARVEKMLRKFKLPHRTFPKIFEGIVEEFDSGFYNNCKIVLAPSEFTKSDLEKKLKTKVGIFSRGIDTERFNPKHKKKYEAVRALYVGRVSIEKNLIVLGEIFKDIQNAELVVVGDGPYRKTLQRKLKNATFRGVLTGKDLSEAYASADVFVFPSETDTFGNVVLEGMSSGLPAIVTDKMGPKEIVTQGKTGFITKDKKEFKEKLKTLIDDEGLRQKMSTNAREYALTRTWDNVFGRLFDSYDEVLKNA